MRLYDNVCFVLCKWRFLFNVLYQWGSVLCSTCGVGAGGFGAVMVVICLRSDCGFVFWV